MDESQLSVDQIKAFLETNPEGQKFIQSVTDAKVTQGIKTWRDNNLDKMLSERVEQEITKRYPAETEEQKRLRQLEERLAASEQARQREALGRKAIAEATHRGLPTDLVDYFVGADEEQTQENLAKLEAVFKAYRESIVEEVYKSAGRTPVVTDAGAATTSFTEAQIAKMSHEERRRNWPAITKAMQEGRIR